MENLKHTPGPWEAETATCGVSATYPIKKYESETNKVSIEDATHFRTIQICKIETDLGRANYTEEQRANQKLISAAPDLLSELLDLIEYLGEDWQNDPQVLKAKEVINKLTS